MKQFKLLIFVKNIDGGTGTFLFNFLKIKKLFKNQLEIKTIVLERPKYRKKGAFTFLHNKDFYPDQYSFLSALKYFFYDISSVKKIINEEKPNVILSINNYPNIVLTLSSFFLASKPKVILTHHSNLYQIIKTRCSLVLGEMLKLLLPFLYKKADLHIAVSKGVSDNINQLSKQENIIVIYNGITLKESLKAKSLNKDRNIISVARLVEQKDHLTLIKAFSLVKKRVPNIKLWILSDGNKRKELEAYVAKLKIENCVKFFGWVRSISPYLEKASFFILSSKREGFALVLIEAMSQGLPIISTDTPFGPREILDNGKYGILVPMKNPQAMADAMYELLTDEKKYRYYSQKSLERVKYFSLDKMLKAYKKIILDLVDKQ